MPDTPGQRRAEAARTEGRKRKDADKGSLMTEARERFDRARQLEYDNDQEALDDLRFMAGDQWPADVKSERDGDGRPCLTINRLPQIVRQVTGDIRINKPSIKVHPVDSGADPERADMISGLIRNIEDASNASIAYNTAVQNATACGKGAFRIVTEYEDDGFDQIIRIERITNPFAVYFDPSATMYTREDAKYCFVIEDMTEDAFKDRWPDASVSEFTSTEHAGYLEGWGSAKEVRVAEYWTKTPVKKTIGRFQTGEVVDLTDITEPERAGMAIEAIREVDGFKVESRIISGIEVLEGPFDHPGKYIPIIPVWGEEWDIGGVTIRNGLIRYSKDPMRMYNYHVSHAVETVALAPKAPFVGTTNQFKGLERYWNQANTKNLPFLAYKPDKDAPGAPQRQPGPEVPAAAITLAQNAAEDIHATTGIYPSSVGGRSNESSGKAILARERQGDVGTFAFVDNLSHSIRHAGRILVDLIPKIYDGERVVRVLGEDETDEMVPINVVIGANPDGSPRVANDLSVGKYDVTITTGPSYSTKRAEAADSMIAFMRGVPDAAGLIGDLIAKNMDWPGADNIADRLHRVAVMKGLAEPKEGDPPPPPNPEAEMEAKQFQAKAIEQAAKMTQARVETEGKELDNAKKQLDLSIQAGVAQQAVQQEIQRLILQALQDTAGQAVGPNGAAPPA